MRLFIAYQAFTPPARQIAALDQGHFAACCDHATAFMPNTTRRAA